MSGLPQHARAGEGPPTLVVEDRVATLQLRRPSQRNSLRDEDLLTLLGYFTEIDADPAIRVVVLTAQTIGQPRPVFCAGYNIGGFDGDQHDPRLFERLVDTLERLRPITVCALSGSVYGGATDMLLACDFRVALEGSEFRMPAVALGLHYYPSGLRRYVARLGLNAAKRAFLTAHAFSMHELDRLGLFECVTDMSRFDAAVDDLVHRLASMAPIAAQTTKKSLSEIAAGRFDEPSLRSREMASVLSKDFAEGRAAFAERRKPNFSGC